jgi:hypothetical protein
MSKPVALKPNGLPLGVSFHKRRGRYQSVAKVEGRQVHLGLFDTPQEAAAAYRAVRKLHPIKAPLRAPHDGLKSTTGDPAGSLFFARRRPLRFDSYSWRRVGAMKGLKALQLLGALVLLIGVWLRHRRRHPDDEPVRGELTDDPATQFTGGEQLHFTSKLVRHRLRSGVGALREMDTFDGLLLHTQFHDGEGHHIDGSAVMVAPGVALCATHVIGPYIEALVAGTATGLCMGITKSGVQIWRVQKIMPVSNSDLTILGLSYASPLPHNKTFNQAFLTTRLPQIGERLTLTGFRANSIEGVRDRTFIARGSVLVCVGEVTAQHPHGRDRAMLPWPALQVDCPAWGGMSGGPVFDENGYVVGLVCSSFSDHTGAASPTYVSLLWPAMPHPYEGGWPSRIFQGTRTLLEVDRRICSIQRPEAITVTDQGDSVTVRYEHWS